MTAKEAIIQRMTNVLKGQAMYIKEDESISAKDKCTQMDVILDLMRFVQDYEECSEVMKKHFVTKTMGNIEKKMKEKGDER
jgi:hypothetical protein